MTIFPDKNEDEMAQEWDNGGDYVIRPTWKWCNTTDNKCKCNDKKAYMETKTETGLHGDKDVKRHK